jgi:hypothetical protein
MAETAEAFATVLTPQEMETILTQRRNAGAVVKAPPTPPPIPLPAQQSEASSSGPPWAPPNSRVPARPTVFPNVENDASMLNMLDTPPEHAPMNIYDFLLTTAINALLIVASSDRVSPIHKQEIRDIVGILRGLTFN